MTKEELDKYITISMNIQSVFDLIAVCNKWITIGDIEFCTSKYAELIEGEAIGIIFDPDNDENILVKTMKGNFIPISISTFLEMLNSRNDIDIRLIVKKIIKNEYFNNISELTKLEEKMLDISNNIKNQKVELERLINEKHKLTNRWQRKNH